MDRTPPLALALALAGCVDESTPDHLSLVCEAMDEACGSQAREAAFRAWADDAIQARGSSFSVWEAAAGGPALRFRACVPRSWGPGVTQAKAAFLSEGARRAAAAALPAEDRVLQGPCQPDDDGAVVGIGPHGAAELNAAGRTEVLVICDVSNSTVGAACTQATLERAFDRWLPVAGPGSTFEVVGVGTSRDTAQTGLFLAKAVADEPGARFAGLLSRRHDLAQVSVQPAGSALAEAMDAATDRRAVPRNVLVLSDMRQVTRLAWNFEGRVPDPARFLGWANRTALAPRLDGADVVACGLHNRTGPAVPAFDGRRAQAIGELWQATFEAWGAQQVSLLADCMDLDGWIPVPGMPTAPAATAANHHARSQEG